MASNGKAADDGLVSDLAASINTSLGNKVPSTRTVNGKALSANVTLAASDIGAVPTTTTVNGKALSSNVTLAAADVSALPSSTTLTVNGTPYNLSSNPSLTVGSGTVDYATNSAWPTSRPVATTVPLLLVDSSGSSSSQTLPSWYISGTDVALVGSATTTGSVEKLTAAEAVFTTDWVAGGNATVATNAGVVTVATDTLTLNPNNFSTNGITSVHANKTYKFEVVCAGGSTGSIHLACQLTSAAGTSLYPYGTGALTNGSTPTVFGITGVAPSDVTDVRMKITGVSTNTAAITVLRASVQELS